MTTEARAVLRTWDQRRGQSPTACVCTGERTTRATRAWAVELPHRAMWERIVGTTATALVARLTRRPHERVVLAVSERAWRRWRVALALAIAITIAGLVVAVVGAAGGDPASVVLGVLLAAWGGRRRQLATRRYWVGLELHAERGEVVVTRCHPAFAEEARRLYVDSIRRHPAPR